jgi:hypothetical protein
MVAKTLFLTPRRSFRVASNMVLEIHSSTIERDIDEKPD